MKRNVSCNTENLLFFEKKSEGDEKKVEIMKMES
jgi:hypothetical protein